MPFIFKKVMQEIPIVVGQECNRCGKIFEGAPAVLTYNTPDGEKTSIYCLECYNLITSVDKIEPSEKNLIAF